MARSSAKPKEETATESDTRLGTIFSDAVPEIKVDPDLTPELIAATSAPRDTTDEFASLFATLAEVETTHVVRTPKSNVPVKPELVDVLTNMWNAYQEGKKLRYELTVSSWEQFDNVRKLITAATAAVNPPISARTHAVRADGQTTALRSEPAPAKIRFSVGPRRRQPKNEELPKNGV